MHLLGCQISFNFSQLITCQDEDEQRSYKSDLMGLENCRTDNVFLPTKLYLKGFLYNQGFATKELGRKQISTLTETLLKAYIIAEHADALHL